MSAHIDLLGCEYLGGCPRLGSRVLNKVELHFDNDGLIVAIAPQGLFTPAAARPVLTLAWPEISVLSAISRAEPKPLIPRRLLHASANVLRMRLELPDQLAVGTPAWTMTIGVRADAAELTSALQRLLASVDGPAPVVSAG